MKQSTIDKALSALDGMREIVRAEMLAQGQYMEYEVSDPKRAKRGAICGGRRACAIGSLWLGAGIKPEKNDYGSLFLPGVEESSRYDFLRTRPALRLAYEVLNEAADDFAVNHRVYMKSSHAASIEALFEGSYGIYLDKKDLLKIIAAAKRKVKAQAK